MSIFGSREDDPLLQDDPFAPSSGDESADEEATDDHESPTPSTSSDGSPSEPTSRRDHSPASRSTTSDTLAGSVFDTAGGPHEQAEEEASSDSGESRVIVRTLEQATSGQLSTLNTAIDDGWRLRRVELRSSSSPDGARSADRTRSLAFVLRRARR